MTGPILRLFDWSALDERARVSALERPAVRANEEILVQVRDVIGQVRRDGDAALRRLTQQFDKVTLDDIAVSGDQIAEAEATVGEAPRAAISMAIRNITRFHAAQSTPPLRVETAPGVICERVSRPIRAVGLYVPAGSAPLPSTAMMLAVPASLAGCGIRVLCTPPRRDGRADPAVVVAARACGVERIFKIGGAQAIAAMAYGTATVPKVDKIFGPGNAWVTAAKQSVSMDPAGAALDMPAGPSEVMVIADAAANPRFVALDLLSQAEHGTDSQVILVTPDRELIDRVRTEIAAALTALPRRAIMAQALEHSAAILVESLGEALTIANRYAPEHLILQVAEPRPLADGIESAGSVFLGAWTPEAVGDYCSGTNHVLPTYGYARTYSGLSLGDFQRRMTLQELTPAGLEGLAATVTTLAGLEGLEAHAEAVRVRMQHLAGGKVMSGIANLVRPEIRRMQPYRSAEFEDGLVRLNANENPWRPPGDTTGPGLNRYPEPRPSALAASLAEHYGVAADQLLVTRGSSEAIDVVIRGFCRAGQDEVVICPPTFGMYEAYAQVQAAPIRRVPLLRDRGYALDTAAILAQWSDASRVLFLCSPNNPTGNSIPRKTIHEIAAGLRDRGVVVLDAAYAEFADEDPMAELLAEFDNVIVLRTLSKAMALAGVRCGALLAAPTVTALLGCVLPPYTFPTVCAEAVQRCLEPGNSAGWRQRVAMLRAERGRMTAALKSLPGVTRVWPSDANFVLIEAADPRTFVAAARTGGVLVRDFSWDPFLPRCVRITVGDPAQNDQLLRALA